jgi:hypothetical protein
LWELEDARKNYITRSVMKEGVTGLLRKLHNEERHDCCSYKTLEETT